MYRGVDIYSDHYLRIAKIVMFAQWKRKKPHIKLNEEAFKIDLLQDSSIKTLYQSHLNQQLQQVETDKTVEIEWRYTVCCIEEAAKETIGKKKKVQSRRGCRLWNDEVAEAVEEKKSVCHVYLQLNTEEARDIYKYNYYINYSEHKLVFRVVNVIVCLLYTSRCV